jgi:hypothetical protein
MSQRKASQLRPVESSPTKGFLAFRFTEIEFENFQDAAIQLDALTELMELAKVPSSELLYPLNKNIQSFRGRLEHQRWHQDETEGGAA